MADNFVANPGAAGDTFAADEIGGVKFPRSKIVIGVDGTNSGDVSASNPLPVTGTVTANAGTGPFPVSDNGGSLTVDGTVAATQSGTWTLGANSGVDIGDVTINNAAGASAVNVQDGGNSLTVDGTVTANAGTGPWPVTDNGGSLTIDAPVGTPAFVRLSDGASAITTLPVSLSGNQAVNVAQINGVTPLMGNGASGTGAQRVTIANDSTGVIATVSTVTAVTNITNWGNIVDNAAFTDGTTRLMPGAYIFDEVAGTALTENDAAAARIDSKRAQVMVVEDATTRGQRQAVDAAGAASVKEKRASTPAQSSVAGSATSVSLLAANANRMGATIVNDSTALLYIKLGATASTTSYSVVLAGATSAPFAYYEVPFNYTGAIDGIWASAAGNARITELT
jgi:hypothetical protein